MKRLIAVDSSANLSCTENTDFVSVPLKIVTDEKEYVDDQALDVPEMLRELKLYKGRSGTSCPSVSDWLTAFGDADEVFGLSLTSCLSGCWNAAQIAVQDFLAGRSGRKAFVLDTLSTGPELELLTEKLRELIGSGNPFESIREEIVRYAKCTHLMFSLKSLSNFAKNGRVSPVLAKAAGILGICIVGRASPEGQLEPQHNARGEKNAIQKLLSGVLEAGYNGGKVRIRHTENPDAAERFAKGLRSSFPSADIRIGRNRGLCSYYAEEGGLLVGFESL